jgi:hypothetical protein
VRPAIGTIELRIFHEIGDKLVSPRPCDQFASYEEVLEDVFTEGSTDVKSPTHGIMYDNQVCTHDLPRLTRRGTESDTGMGPVSCVETREEKIPRLFNNAQA